MSSEDHVLVAARKIRNRHLALDGFAPELAATEQRRRATAEDDHQRYPGHTGEMCDTGVEAHGELRLSQQAPELGQDEVAGESYAVRLRVDLVDDRTFPRPGAQDDTIAPRLHVLD